MIVKIVFQTNSVPVVYTGVRDVYTKGGLLCLSFDENTLKFPLCNIFYVDSDYSGEES